MVQNLINKLNAIKSEIKHYREDVDEDKEQKARDAEYILESSYELQKEILDTIHIQEMEINDLRTRMFLAEEEIKKFTYERRKLNIGN